MNRFLTTSVALIALCQPAQADGFQFLGRLIFGTGTAKPAVETPQSVTALEQSDFDARQPVTLSDLFRGVPGITIAGASARVLGQSFNIRGVGNAEQSASEERIKVSVDGAPKFFEQYRMGSFFGDLDLYKRVEVLRGPAAATLNGSGAIGGAVNFTTKDAGDFLAEGETRALRPTLSYGSNGDSQRVGVIWAERRGNVEFLGALNRSSGGAMVDGLGKMIAGTAHESSSALVKAKVNLEGGSVTFAFSQTDTDLEDTLVAQTGGAAVSGFGTADIAARDTTASLTWARGGTTVTLSHTETDVTKDNFSMGSMCAAGTLQVLCNGEFAYATTALKAEHRLEFGAGQWANSVTLGTQLSRQERTATSSLGAMGFHPEGSDEKAGVYAQGEFVYADRLTLIPGIRVDYGTRTPSAASTARGAAEDSDQALSAKLQAMYEVNDAWGVFGTLAQTERMPTLDELYSYGTARSGALLVPSLGLEKEKAETIELGFTFQREGILSEGDSLQVKTTLFHNDFDNMIVVNPSTVSGSANYINLNKAETWGAELEAAYDAEKWFANLGYSKVESRNRTAGTAYGTTLTDTPAETVSLTLGAKLMEQALTLGWRGTWVDEITTVSATTSADAYATHDLFVTYTPQSGVLQGVDISLAVENVFDVQYRNNLALDNAAGLNAKLTLGRTFTW